MTTTTFNHTGFRTLRSSRDRLAGKGFFQTLLGALVNSRKSEADAIVARYSGDRWCDSTERRLIGDMAHRDVPPFNP